MASSNKMKILLLGEYSNVHWTLAQGLRSLGHEVTVASNGDFWKNIPRDISVVRHGYGMFDTLRYVVAVKRALRRMKGYDVVQIINPLFLEMKAERIRPIYKYLRNNNKKVFMGAYGMDYYWVTTCRDCHTFRYSDFNFGSHLRTDDIAMRDAADWLDTEKGKLNREIAADCDGIIAGLYEYFACYHPHFPEKTTFIPFPINTDEIKRVSPAVSDKVRFFIGIQRTRSRYKGTDVMLRALERVVAEHPDRCEISMAESVPYPQYCSMLDSSQVLLDQLYSYTPAMNGLLAMAKGMVLVGGGEEENYEILGEKELRPIINVLPDENNVYERLTNLALHPEMISRLQADSRLYIERYHDYRLVAQQYIDFWTKNG